MLNNEDYIRELEERLQLVEDKKLVSLVQRLIEERNNLDQNIKIDPLTGLYNRRILSKVRDYGTVIMCDIDNFKKVNDTYGHDMGDEVIKGVAQILLNNVRIGDVVCRLGGDEYLVIMTTNRVDVIDQRMHKIEEDVKKNIQLPNCDVSLSIGVSFNPGDKDLSTLITEADEALYQSKGNGKSQITYYGNYKKQKVR